MKSQPMEDRMAEKDDAVVRDMLLAGKTMESVWTFFEGEMTRYHIRKLRDDIFGGLQSSAASVHALAAGPILNPNELVRYKHPRPVKRGAPLVQLPILDIVDGHMGRTA